MSKEYDKALKYYIENSIEVDPVILASHEEIIKIHQELLWNSKDPEHTRFLKIKLKELRKRHKEKNIY